MFSNFIFLNFYVYSILQVIATSQLLLVSSLLHPFKSHCEKKAMRDEG